MQRFPQVVKVGSSHSLILLSRIFFISLVIGLSFFKTYSQSTDKCFRVGMHAPGVSYFNRESLFINLFLNNGGFQNMDNIAQDANGYPLEIPYTNPNGTVYDQTATVLSVRNSFLWNDSIYIVRWDGDGEFEMYSWSPGQFKTTGTLSGTNGRFEFTPQWDGNVDQFNHQLWLRIKKSAKSNHVRNIRIYLKSQEDLYENKGEKFHPMVMDKLKPFYTLRFMGSFNINGSPFREWSDRTPYEWYQQNGPKNNGLAYEWATDLCNHLQKHMWFNVPHAADDYSIRKMAEIVHTRLDAGLDVYLEYSNETWNFGGGFYPQFDYTQKNGGHAKLSKNVFKIWREVFGRDSLRVRRVVAVFPGGVPHITYDRVRAFGLDDFDVYAPTYYFGFDGSAFNASTSKQTMADSIFSSIRGGSWYKMMKEHYLYAKSLGKEVFCYEGGHGRDQSDALSYMDNWRSLQKDPVMKTITQEVIDSLTSIGISGGNELALFGGWDTDTSPSGGLWGTLNNMYDNVNDFPKYSGYTSKIKDCDKIISTSDTIGSGMAIHLSGAADYVDASTSYKPNDQNESYSIEAWVHPEYLGADQYIWTLGSASIAEGNVMYISKDNRFEWLVKDNSGAQITALHGPLVEENKWVHLMAVKNGSTYTLYVNGTSKSSSSVGGITDCMRSFFTLGGNKSGGNKINFTGAIDEVRIWNTGINNLSTIRDWMCKKLNSKHPNFINLRSNYRFDNVDRSGKVKDQFGLLNASLINVNFSKYSNYEISSAPIGDNSTQIYPEQWNNVSLSFVHPNGDKISTSGIGKGNPEGVHIYLVNQKPVDNKLPSSQYQSMGNYYYGVFAANGKIGDTISYTVIYNYNGNPDASSSTSNNRLLKRIDNADQNGWQNTGAISNEQVKNFITRTGRESYRGEYIIAQREYKTNNIKGPGYAASFTGGSASMLFKRPDDQYTVSFWFKNTNRDTYKTLINFIGPGLDVDYTNVGTNNGQVYLNSVVLWDPALPVSGAVFDLTSWNHVAIKKKDDLIHVYINGMEIPGVGPLKCGTTTAGRQRDINYVKMVLGAQDGCLMDELQIWDIALEEKLIKDWMCRKITNRHPLEAEHLLLYYTFDEGQGNILENSRGAGDLNLSGGVGFVPSGAPIGDTSVYLYAENITDNWTQNISHPDGDYLSATKTSGRSFGVHLYRTDGKASFSAIPAEAKSYDSTRYWGVFPIPVGYAGSMQYSYNCKYFYQKNKNVAEENNIRLLDRTNNADSAWFFNTPSPDLTLKDFSKDYSTPSAPGYWEPYAGVPREMMLGGTTATAIQILNNKPLSPGPIYGPDNVCSGATGIRYSVKNIPGLSYVWKLPSGISGYSDSSFIFVSVSPNALGNLGNISVYAVNNYGVKGDSSFKLAKAQAVPSLSEDIEGPSDVCFGQKATYSIPAVNGSTAYKWTVPSDANIVLNNGNSITVQFGTKSDSSILVKGLFAGCGYSQINNKVVNVNTTPKSDLVVSGGRACKGDTSQGSVIIEKSQAGIIYQAYKNGGSSPIGNAVTGSGENIAIALPLADITAGDNQITIKAKIPGCTETFLKNTATFTVDISPDPDMDVVYSSTLCKGENALFSFPNAISGMKITPTIKNYWRVDSPFEQTLILPFLLSNPDKSISIPPSIYHGQLCLYGVNIGKNDIVFKVTNGSCRAVTLNKIATVNVPNNPRAIDFNAYNWWIYSNPATLWSPLPDINDAIARSVPDHGCSSDTIKITITGAQKDIKYFARVGSLTGSIVSDQVICTVERSQLILKILPGTLPLGNQTIFVMAKGNDCEVLVNYETSININPGADVTKVIYGSTVCPGDSGSITIQGSQPNMAYSVFQNNTLLTQKNGTGNDLKIPIAPTLLNAGDNIFSVNASSTGCASLAFPNNPIINVTNIITTDNLLTFAFDVDTICKGLDDSLNILSSVPGVSYQAYSNGNVIGTPAIGTGQKLAVLLPYTHGLDAYENQKVTISVKASAGSCLNNISLSNTRDLYVNASVDLSNEVVKTSRTQHWAGYFAICPEEAYGISFPAQVQNVNGAIYPTYIQAAFTDESLKKDTLLNISAYQASASGSTSGEWADLRFSKAEMPRRSSHHIKFMVKEKGCPLHQAKSAIEGNNNPIIWPVLVYPDYIDNQPVTTDTICLGDNAVFGLKSQESVTSLYTNSVYTVYNAQNNLILTAYPWTARTTDGSLEMAVNASELTKPGLNQFSIQQSFIGCGIHDLPVKGSVFVNTPPDTDLEINSVNECNGNGQIKIKNSQFNVRYQPVINGNALQSPSQGNGADLYIIIDSKSLSTGINEVSLQATLNGCKTTTMSERASIEVTSKLPSAPLKPLGERQFCPGATLTYKVPNDSTVSEYLWKLPAGSTTNSKGNIAEITFGNSEGEIRVSAKNSCGTSAASDSLTARMKGSSNGQVDGGGNLCAGESKILTLNNYSGIIIKWQISIDSGSTWRDTTIISQNFTVSSSLIGAAEFRAVTSDGGTCGFSYSKSAVVRRNSSAPVDLVANPSQIISGNKSTISLNNSFSDIVWQQSDDTLKPWITLSTSAATLTTDQLYQNTFYRAIVNSSSCSDTSNTIMVSVIKNNTKDTLISSSSRICSGAGVQLNYSNTSASLQWQDSIAGGIFKNIIGAYGPTYAATSLQNQTWYRVLVIKNGSTSFSNTISVMVDITPNAGTASALPNQVAPGGNTLLSLSQFKGIIQWQDSTEGTIFKNILSANESNYQSDPINKNTFFRAVVSSGVCPNQVSNTVEVTLIDSTKGAGGIVIATADTVCYGGVATLKLSGYNGNIQWQNSTDGIGFSDISNVTNNSLTTTPIIVSTYYRAKVTFKNTDYFSNIVTIETDPLIDSLLEVQGGNYCYNEAAKVTIFKTQDQLKYRAFLSNGLEVISEQAMVSGNLVMNIPQTYLLTGNNFITIKASTASCKKSISLENNASVILGDSIPMPKLEAGNKEVCPDDIEIYLAKKINSNYSYHWISPMSAEILKGEDSIKVQIKFKETITARDYLKLYASKGNCKSDTLKVEIRNKKDCMKLFIPNIFSSTWEIDGLENYPNANIKVLSRWGSLVYESKGYKTPWNGHSKSGELPSSTYYYIIDIDGKEKNALTGSVTIMR